MKNVRDCRAMGSLFRQFAVFDPVHSSKFLIEAQRWEHLAEAEISDYFRQCNVTGPDDAGKSGAADPRLTAGPRPRAA